MIESILISGNLSKLRNDLIGKSLDEYIRLAKQKQFASLVVNRKSEEFIGYFKSRCKTEVLEQKSIAFPLKNLTESEFSDPPIDTEQMIFHSLRNIPHRLAASPAFWTSYHLVMVKEGCIEPSYLAKTWGGSTGRARVEKALQSSNENERPLDDCVRTVLRRLGGLPEARGSVSVFQDCRTARSWWRGLFADEVCGELGMDEDKVWKALRTNQIWEQLTGYVVQKLTVLGDTKIRIPLIAYFALMEPIPNDREEIQKILNRIGQRTAYQMMGILSPKENLEIIESICS